AAGAGVSSLRQFTLLSLITIGGSTLLFGFALSHFVEQGILDREWVSTAALVRAAARFHLQTTDFAAEAGAGAGDSGDRFEEFTRQVPMLPEIQRVTPHNTRGQPPWIDAHPATARGAP